MPVLWVGSLEKIDPLPSSPDCTEHAEYGTGQPLLNTVSIHVYEPGDALLSFRRHHQPLIIELPITKTARRALSRQAVSNNVSHFQTRFRLRLLPVYPTTYGELVVFFLL